MTPDQVEDAGWSPEDWSSLNVLAARVVAENAQLRQVIPEGPRATNAYLVEQPVTAQRAGAGAKPAALSFSVTGASAVVRTQVDFDVAADQTHDLENVRSLVRIAARKLANVEDLVLAFGAAAATTMLGSAIGVVIGASRGIAEVKPAPAPPVLDVPRPPATPFVDPRIRPAVRELRRRGYGGPLGAVVGFDAYQDLATELQNGRTGLDRAKILLGSHDSQIASAPPAPAGAPAAPNLNERLAVFVPDPGAIDLVWAKSVQVSYVGISNGDLRLRIEESFLLRIKDEEAIQLVDL